MEIFMYLQKVEPCKHYLYIKIRGTQINGDIEKYNVSKYKEYVLDKCMTMFRSEERRAFI